MDPMKLLLIAPGVLVALIVAWALHKRRRFQARLMAEQQLAIERQRAVIEQLDAVGGALAKPGLPEAELLAVLDAAEANLKLLDEDGMLAPLIADNRNVVMQEIEKRRRKA